MMLRIIGYVLLLSGFVISATSAWQLIQNPAPANAATAQCLERVQRVLASGDLPAEVRDTVIRSSIENHMGMLAGRYQKAIFCGIPFLLLMLLGGIMSGLGGMKKQRSFEQTDGEQNE